MNDRLLALVASIVLPESAPPLEAIPHRDLVLTALITCYKKGLSPEESIAVLHRCGVSQDEARGAFERLVFYYAQKN